MFKVITNGKIAPLIYKMSIETDFIAQKARPGQFVMIRIDEQGERIPLTIADTGAGIITIVYQVVGVTTDKLSKKKKGDYLSDVLGPLGHATEIRKIGIVCCVGGGVGIAELYPAVKAYKAIGNDVIVIIGARNKELLIFKNELEKTCDELLIATDDGSSGEKGFVSDILKKTIDSKRKIDLMYTVGPAVMMEVISNLTRPHGIKTLVSLNTILVDGTGMCGSCRVEVGGETKFVCVDGPEFDGHKVNFKELKLRQSLFKEQESHACKIKGVLK